MGESMQIEPYEITTDILFREILYLETGHAPGNNAKCNGTILYSGIMSGDIDNKLFEGFLV
jgi:hypothetical protein